MTSSSGGEGAADEAVSSVSTKKKLPSRRVRGGAAAIGIVVVVAYILYLSSLSASIAECESLWTPEGAAMCSEMFVHPCACPSVVIVDAEANVTAAAFYLTGVERFVAANSGASGDIVKIVRGLAAHNAASLVVLNLQFCAFDGKVECAAAALSGTLSRSLTNAHIGHTGELPSEIGVFSNLQRL